MAVAGARVRPASRAVPVNTVVTTKAGVISVRDMQVSAAYHVTVFQQVAGLE